MNIGRFPTSVKRLRYSGSETHKKEAAIAAPFVLNAQLLMENAGLFVWLPLASVLMRTTWYSLAPLAWQRGYLMRDCRHKESAVTAKINPFGIGNGRCTGRGCLVVRFLPDHAASQIELVEDGGLAVAVGVVIDGSIGQVPVRGERQSAGVFRFRKCVDGTDKASLLVQVVQNDGTRYPIDLDDILNDHGSVGQHDHILKCRINVYVALDEIGRLGPQ